MALPNKVGLSYALGVPGQQVVIGQAEYLSYNPLSDGTAKAGAFCFKKAGSGNGEVFAHASLTGTDVLGFVERVVDTFIANVLNDHTEAYPEGAALTVAIRGQYYIEAPAAISGDGLKVWVNGSTGAIRIGAEESGSTEIDTGWTCRIPNGGTSAAQGDIVVIERF